jgi:hypothetical protein
MIADRRDISLFFFSSKGTSKLDAQLVKVRFVEKEITVVIED